MNYAKMEISWIGALLTGIKRVRLLANNYLFCLLIAFICIFPGGNVVIRLLLCYQDEEDTRHALHLAKH